MEGKARFIFPVVITAMIVFVVSGAVTFFNIGWRDDLVIRWWSAFAIGWPIGASTAYRDHLRPQPHPALRRRRRKARLILPTVGHGHQSKPERDHLNVFDLPGHRYRHCPAEQAFLFVSALDRPRRVGFCS
jgi:Protein of unknown function (DUF2798)